MRNILELELKSLLWETTNLTESRLCMKNQMNNISSEEPLLDHDIVMSLWNILTFSVWYAYSKYLFDLFQRCLGLRFLFPVFTIPEVEHTTATFTTQSTVKRGDIYLYHKFNKLQNDLCTCIWKIIFVNHYEYYHITLCR